MTNFCLPQPSFVPVKNNLKEDGTSYAMYRASCLSKKAWWSNFTHIMALHELHVVSVWPNIIAHFL